MNFALIILVSSPKGVAEEKDHGASEENVDAPLFTFSIHGENAVAAPNPA
jgi:hypothetical protein